MQECCKQLETDGWNQERAALIVLRDPDKSNKHEQAKWDIKIARKWLKRAANIQKNQLPKLGVKLAVMNTETMPFLEDRSIPK